MIRTREPIKRNWMKKGIAWGAILGLASTVLNQVNKNKDDGGGAKGTGDLLTRGLRFDKGKDWWKDSLTGFGFLGGAEGGGAGGEGSGEFLPYKSPGSYFESPYYDKTQGQLYNLGSNMLKGDMPSYYSSIGETGGPEFEAMLKNLNVDVSDIVSQSAAARNTGRGGILSKTVASKVGDVSTKLRWDDYIRALKGKEGLLGLGTNLVSGVRGAGQARENAKNTFNLNEASMFNQFNLKRSGLAFDIDQANQEPTGQWGEIIGSLLNTATNLYGSKNASGGGVKLGSAEPQYAGKIAVPSTPASNKILGEYKPLKYQG